jgi:hypothetical protein
LCQKLDGDETPLGYFLAKAGTFSRADRKNMMSVRLVKAKILFALLASTGCGYSYTISSVSPLVLPGSRAFFVKRVTIHASERSQFTLHRSLAGPGWSETRYTAVSLETCEVLGERSFPEQTDEYASGSGTLWISNSNRKVAESFDGGSRRIPDGARPLPGGGGGTQLRHDETPGFSVEPATAGARRCSGI